MTVICLRNQVSKTYDRTDNLNISPCARNVQETGYLALYEMEEKRYLAVYETSTRNLWGSASNCNLEILERFQSKVLRIITDAPWYVPNAVIQGIYKCYRSDKKCETTVSPTDRNYSVTYRQRLADHPNSLAKSLLQRTNYNRGLKRYYPADLTTRF